MKLQDYFSDDQWLPRVALTLVLFAVFVVGRRMATRLVRGKAEVLDAMGRRQVFYVRSAFNLALAVALLMIWLGHVQNLVLSLTAVTVAVVLATKELLMCVSGFALRTGASLFSVGDWIEVDGLRGEVSDYNLLSTTLLVLAPPERGHGYTGEVVVIPNSLFLSHPVRSGRLGRHYVQHAFTVTVEAGIDVKAALAWWAQAADAACADFAEEAARVGQAAARALSADVQGPAPVIHVGSTDGGLLGFNVQLFCPAARSLALQGALSADFLSAVAQGEFALARADQSTAIRAGD